MATKSILSKGRQAIVYTYPSRPDSDHQWCPKCKRALVNMKGSLERTCPLCGNQIKSKRRSKDGKTYTIAVEGRAT